MGAISINILFSETVVSFVIVSNMLFESVNITVLIFLSRIFVRSFAKAIM